MAPVIVTPYQAYVVTALERGAPKAFIKERWAELQAVGDWATRFIACAKDQAVRDADWYASTNGGIGA